ncbi:hypothetical protein PAXINDRAFT_15556 [Paxillus involutus ATCC 200175]|uniref:FTP domain-containing protein n=1 Tax=Paxillus involutus ATCC 200175 TaxID=664439 RepID=A0A0C9TLN1_PAXIN|nr:hypothetical protein PAXINDRAFT_15556 [Paxillus involutus ATCC 200175]
MLSLIPHLLPPPNPSPCRKTLGFGSVLPHARFEVNVPVAAGLYLHDVHTNPYAVALHCMTQYNDPESGQAVKHIYARQIGGGIEVTDAHVNLNIKDGRVLSFGDSVLPPWWRAHPTYRVVCPFPRRPLRPDLSSHRTLLHSPSATQSHMGSHDHAKIREGLATLKHLHSSNCASVPSFGPSRQVDLEMDPRRPLLAFLASALPEDHPELSSILDNAEEYAREQLPNLGAFVPPGLNFDTVSSAPGLGCGPTLGKALAVKKPKKSVMQRKKVLHLYLPN